MATEKYQAFENEETITIEIGKSLALVLDDWLYRLTGLSEERTLHIENDAEWWALVVLHATLETHLAELFMPDYAKHVEQARKKVIDQWGMHDG